MARSSFLQLLHEPAVFEIADIGRKLRAFTDQQGGAAVFNSKGWKETELLFFKGTKQLVFIFRCQFYQLTGIYIDLFIFNQLIYLVEFIGRPGPVDIEVHCIDRCRGTLFLVWADIIYFPIEAECSCR